MNPRLRELDTRQEARTKGQPDFFGIPLWKPKIRRLSCVIQHPGCFLPRSWVHATSDQFSFAYISVDLVAFRKTVTGKKKSGKMTNLCFALTLEGFDATGPQCRRRVCVPAAEQEAEQERGTRMWTPSSSSWWNRVEAKFAAVFN